MKKFFIAALFAVALIGFAQSCTNDTAEEQKLYTDSPDPDEYKRPGGGS